jgi:threonine/homoserine/homoserine lactone efflux protein
VFANEDRLAMPTMTDSSLLAFVVTTVLIELTPGPNMGYLAVLAASAGSRAGLAATAGVAVGLLGIGIASALGLAAIVAASNAIYELLRWGGAIYLLWLAWEGFRALPEGIEKPVDLNSHTRFFLRGLITNLLNPKAAVFYLSVFPAFIDRDRPLLAQTAILLAVYVTVATVIHSSVVLGAAAVRPILQSRGNVIVVRRVMSASLLVVAAWLLYTTHRVVP